MRWAIGFCTNRLHRRLRHGEPRSEGHVYPDNPDTHGIAEREAAVVPAKRQGRALKQLALDVEAKILPIIRVDSQHIIAILEVKTDHPVIPAREGA